MILQTFCKARSRSLSGKNLSAKEVSFQGWDSGGPWQQWQSGHPKVTLIFGGGALKKMQLSSCVKGAHASPPGTHRMPRAVVPVLGCAVAGLPSV